MSPLLKSTHYRSTGFIIVPPDLQSGGLFIFRQIANLPVRVRELISGTKLPAEVSSGLLTQPSLNRDLPAPSSFFVRSIQILLQRRRILAVILRREETVEFNPGILRRIRSMHDVFL